MILFIYLKIILLQCYQFQFSIDPTLSLSLLVYPLKICFVILMIKKRKEETKREPFKKWVKDRKKQILRQCKKTKVRLVDKDHKTKREGIVYGVGNFFWCKNPKCCQQKRQEVVYRAGNFFFQSCLTRYQMKVFPCWKLQLLLMSSIQTQVCMQLCSRVYINIYLF